MVKHRIFGLDILRFIAIISVVIGHIFHILPTIGTNPIFERLIFIDGVSVFFTLSGFLIGSILFKTFSQGNLTVNTLFEFWKARWWRTLPAYFFILFCIIILSQIKKEREFSFFLPYFFFLQNLKTGFIHEFAESWSLAVEEWFYLTTPILFFIGSRLIGLKNAAPIIIGCIFLLGNGIRIFKMQYYAIDTYQQLAYDIHMTIPSRIDAVMFGVLGAYLNFYHLKIWTNYKNSFFWIGIVGFLINHVVVNMETNPLNFYSIYFHKQFELFMVLMTIPKFSTLREGKGIFAKIVTFVSLTSYSIYLVHGSIYINFIQPLLPVDFYIQLPIYLIWAFAGAYLLYSTVEKWGMRQRDKQKAKKIKLLEVS